MELKIRNRTVVHLQVRAGSGPGFGLLEEERSKIDFPMPILDGLRVVRDVWGTSERFRHKDRHENKTLRKIVP